MKVQKKQRTIGMPTRTQINAGGFDMDCVDKKIESFDCPYYAGDLAWVCNQGVDVACQDFQSTCLPVAEKCRL